jgi:radical SAM superfamily enzyme YgiQ (UPF0313 family)
MSIEQQMSSGLPLWDLQGIERKYSNYLQCVDDRIPVYFIHDSNAYYLPMALGMMYAQIRKADSRLASYRFLPVWDMSVPQIASLSSKLRPGVWLFSDYLWTLDTNIWLSRQVKQYSADCIVIHGGPSAPNYDGASREFLRAHSEVDIIVRGEGESTILELLAALALCRHQLDWSPLEKVAGIIYRQPSDGCVVRTEDRGRADLENLASPYLDGSFNDYGAPVLAATVETNRGCPYGCTFCDWGSATLQKIRLFDLDRVKAEIEWVSRRKIKILWVADANFGIFDRDVEIAKHISRCRIDFEYPQQVVVNYAKNATKRVADIVREFRKSGVSGQGILAIQTTDETTLNVIRRKNIKTERYDELMTIFRREQLPLSTDLIAGLPGSTVESFKNDLQYYFDRRVSVKVYDSILLPNSPMADPEYIKQYQIEVDAFGNVISTSTFSREQKIQMTAISKFYSLFVEYGLLRYVLHYLEWTRRMRSVDVIEHLVLAANTRSNTPNLSWLASYGWPKPLPPGGWSSLYGEVSLVLAELGIEMGRELATVVKVNRKVMPEKHRRFPETIELQFDFVRFFQDRMDPQGSRRPLSKYKPGKLIVRDPQNLCQELFENTFLYGMNTVHWELDSDLRITGMIPKHHRASEVIAPSLAGV